MNRIDFTIDVPEHPVMIYYDPKMLEKVLFNLMSNAFKVTGEQGKIQIKLVLSPDTEGKSIRSLEGWVGIEISDTGPGLDKDQVNKIFERFYQIDNLNKAYYTSSGIGLSLAKNLVEMHKGIIDVNSVKGEGSVFRVLLQRGARHFQESELTTEKTDVVSTSLDIQTKEEMTSLSDTIKGNKLSVLLVEDNTELRDYLKSELKHHYKVYEANNGITGLELIRKHLPDIVVSDVLMPDKNGFELCEELKSDLQISHIPVILLTAKGTVEDQIQGAEVGADAYLVKPFHPRLLKSKMQQLLKSREELFKRYSSQLNLIPEESNYNLLDKDFLTRVSDYVIEHISDPELSVEEVGTKMNLSRSQLYRKIKSLTGYSVNEFIRVIRLEQAKKLISTRKYTINEVGYNVGFSSPSYFSKCYKEHFGNLPSDDSV